MTSVKEHGATGSTLTIKYRAPRNRVWDANRFFYVEIPKNPIHYIEYGQSPTSAIDEENYEVTAKLVNYGDDDYSEVVNGTGTDVFSTENFSFYLEV